MIHDPVPPEAWAAEGARVAEALEDVAAAVIIGSDADVALIVAMAIARAQRDGRSVAIGDLVGGLAPLSAPLRAHDGAHDGAPDGAPGLLECFRDGVPVSDIARPLSDDPPIFALPSGNGPIAERWVFESARWTRLIAGFREVDALLLLIAPPLAPGLASLIGVVDGVVAVDLPPVVARAWPLLATVDRPEAELPVIHAVAGPRVGVRRRRFVRAAGALGVLAIAMIAGLLLTTDRWRGAAALAAGTIPGAPTPGADAPLLPTDTITLGPVVNPADSKIASSFAVELVAANTLSGANSRLAIRGEKLPAPTLVPVLLGSDGRPWFRALTGAWRQRDEAQSWLNALRARGLVRHNVGRVVHVPYALLLAKGIPQADVPTGLAQWAARGVSAYALVQDDGSACVYAGAFETSGQAALLAKSLRDLGTVPVLAFRTGRTF